MRNQSSMKLETLGPLNLYGSNEFEHALACLGSNPSFSCCDAQFGPVHPIISNFANLIELCVEIQWQDAFE
jgi:hypothetical protein